MRFFAAVVGCWIVLIGGFAQAQRPDPGLKAMANASTDIVVAEVIDTKPRRAMEAHRDTAKLKVARGR